MGSIVKRWTKDRKTGKRRAQFHIVYYTGARRWSEKKQAYVSQQKWEKAPPELNTQRSAAKLLAQREAEVLRGEYVEHRKTLFSELAQDWLKSEVQPTARPTTIERYNIVLRNHLLPIFGATYIENIRPRDIQAFAAQKVADGLANATIQQQLTVLRSVLAKAVEWGLLRSNPATGFKIRLPQEPPSAVRPLNPDEIRLFLDHTPARWYALFVFTWSGMRLSEILAAKWANLDWEKGRYNVRESLTRKRLFARPKTPSSEAPVPLSEFVMETLKQHRQDQAEHRLLMGAQYQDQDLIFPALKGTPTCHETVNKGAIKSILKNAGLRPIRFHDLRHTCASLMIKNGESPKTIQRQLRHSSIKMTLDTYGHLFPEDEDRAVARLDALIWEQQSTSV